jgi:D-3-phosphoglycerate dehydrogenase
MTYRVLIMEKMDPAGPEFLEAHGCEVRYSRSSTEEEYRKEMEVWNPHGLFVRSFPVTPAMMKAAPALRAVSVHGTGYDNIDMPYAAAHHIQVLHLPAGNYISVAEHALFLIMACAKRYGMIRDPFKKGDYDVRYRVTDGGELRHKTLGIIGWGHSGRELGRMAAEGLRMNILVWTGGRPMTPPDWGPVCQAESRDRLLAASDFVALCIPSTPETKYGMTYPDFMKMKKSACLINTSRGNLIRETDMIRALQEGVIRGAGLDVFDQEPPAPDNPLLTMDQVIATPHFAAVTEDAMYRMSLEGARELCKALRGDKPQWPVNS